MKWLIFLAVGLVGGLVVLWSGRIRRSLLIALVIALQVGVFIYFGEPQRRWGGSSGPTSFYLAFVALIAISVLVARKFGKERLPFLWGGRIAAAAFVLLATTFLTIIVTSERKLVLYYLFEQCQWYLVFLATLNGITALAEARLVANLLTWTLATQAAVGLLQSALGVVFTLTGEVAKGTGPLLRPVGTIAEAPAHYASFILVLLLLATARLLTVKKGGGTARLALIVGLGVTALIVTFTRAAWVGFALGFVVLLVIGGATRRIRIGKLALLSTIAVFALIVLWPLISIRLADNAQDAFNERENLMKIAWNVIAENPVLGVGAGSYAFVYGGYVPSDLPRDQWLYVVHNVYLLRWAETGTIGLIGFLAFWILALAEARVFGTVDDDVLRAWRPAWAAAVVALLWEMSWDTGLGFQTNALVWMALGIGESVRRFKAIERPAANRPHRLVIFRRPVVRRIA